MEKRKEPKTQYTIAVARLGFSAKTARMPNKKAANADKMPISFIIRTSDSGYMTLLSFGAYEAKKWIKTEATEKPKASESNIINPKKDMFWLKIAWPLSS